MIRCHQFNLTRTSNILLLSFLTICNVISQDIDTNLTFSRSFKNEKIHFISKLNDSITLAASQKNAYLFNNNLVTDTLDYVQNLKNNNLIQNVEKLGDNKFFIGTMKNLMIFEYLENKAILLSNIRYDKSFYPWKDHYQLRFLTEHGFFGVTVPVGKRASFEVFFYPKDENYEKKILVYKDANSDFSVLTRSERSKGFDFVGGTVLINDLLKSKTILFDQSSNSAQIIGQPIQEKFLYSFISRDHNSGQYYLLYKGGNIETEVRKFDVELQSSSSKKWIFDYDIFTIDEDIVWYKKIILPERILGIFSFPFDEKEREKVNLLEKVIIDSNH